MPRGFVWIFTNIDAFLFCFEWNVCMKKMPDKEPAACKAPMSPMPMLLYKVTSQCNLLCLF